MTTDQIKAAGPLALASFAEGMVRRVLEWREIPPEARRELTDVANALAGLRDKLCTQHARAEGGAQ